jgi:hypothetical protein
VHWLQNLQWKKVSARGFPHVFRNPQFRIPNPSTGSTIPGARESIPVVIPFDLSRKKKKGAMMQKANVGDGSTKINEIVRQRELPCVRRTRALYKRRVVLDAVPMSMEKKMMKKQRRGKKKRIDG